MNFCYSFRIFPISLWFSATITACSKRLLSFSATFLFFIDGIYCCFLAFYLIRRIVIWSTTIWIHFATFLIQQINMIRYKLTTFHWFQIILIASLKWIIKLFYNFIFFIINHDFHVVIFWMHYTLFIIIYSRNIPIYYC